MEAMPETITDRPTNCQFSAKNQGISMQSVVIKAGIAFDNPSCYHSGQRSGVFRESPG